MNRTSATDRRFTVGWARRARAGLRTALVTLLMISLFIEAKLPRTAAASPWDVARFPNVWMTTQHGERVRFFDDLVEDKVVVINFIYTSCVDTCPMETAYLTRVAEILGERVGQDVFFYSITIDPAIDTPAVLRRYAERYGADWTFLTGDEADITLLRRSLGLYIEDIQDGSNNHNVSMIIGSEATGQWRKSSPFENPHVSAEKIGRWLTGWKEPSTGGEYATAPALRRLSRGEQLFRSRCSGCHTIGGDAPGSGQVRQGVGPDLTGVTRQRERKWLIDWISAPDEMLERGDPIALALLSEYGNLPMPNLRLNQVDVMAVIDYLHEHGSKRANSSVRDDVNGDHSGMLTVRNARIRAPVNDEPATAGYASWFNGTASSMNIVALESSAFERIEMHESVIGSLGATMRRIDSLDVPPGARIDFEPGGRHLMMIGPQQPLLEGQSVGVTVTLSTGRRHEIPFHVVASAVPGHESDHAAGHESNHVAGHAAGHTAGHESDHATGHESNHDAGHAAGHTAGHDSDHAAGHESGHVASHAAGHTAGHESDHASDLDSTRMSGH